MSHDPIYYARITTITAKIDAVDDVIAVYRGRSRALVTATQGLVTMFGLVHRPTGHALGITVWESVADQDRTQVKRIGTETDLSSYAPFMRGGYTHDAYDVTHYALPSADPEQPDAPAVARVTTEHIRPDRWDEGTAALLSLVRGQCATQVPGSGSVLVEHRGVGRAMLIEMAGSPGQLDLPAGRIREHDLAARRNGYLARRIEREVYEVMARY